MSLNGMKYHEEKNKAPEASISKREKAKEEISEGKESISISGSIVAWRHRHQMAQHGEISAISNNGGSINGDRRQSIGSIKMKSAAYIITISAIACGNQHHQRRKRRAAYGKAYQHQNAGAA